MTIEPQFNSRREWWRAFLIRRRQGRCAGFWGRVERKLQERGL